jgi:hypothetical protein
MTAGPNAFLELAEQQITAPVKARHRAAERRAETRIDKEAVDRSRLLRAWLQLQQRQIDDALVGPHGAQIAALLAFLKELSLDRGDELVKFVRAGGWQSADADTRYLVLRLASSAIVKLREKAGLPPFDDALPFGNEPPTVFQIIRGMLR